jgi:hypothetical protein
MLEAAECQAAGVEPLQKRIELKKQKGRFLRTPPLQSTVCFDGNRAGRFQFFAEYGKVAQNTRITQKNTDSENRNA